MSSAQALQQQLQASLEEFRQIQLGECTRAHPERASLNAATA